MVDVADEQPKLINVRDFSPGLNTKLDATEIQDGNSVLLQNFLVSTPGEIKKSLGHTQIADQIDTKAIGGLGYFRKSDRLIRVSNGEVFVWDGTSGTWGTKIGDYDDSPGQTIIINGNNNNLSGPAIFFLGDPSSVPQSWDGITFRPEPTIPPGKFGVWFQNRLFTAGSTTDPHKVSASDILDINVFAVGSAFEIDSGSNGEIIWLHPFRQENLIVLKEDSIHLLNVTGGTPVTDWSVRAIDFQNGCAAGRCTATAGSDVLYMDRFGNIRSINQTIQDTEQGTSSLPISDPIEPFIKRINKRFISLSHAIIFNNLYILSVPLDPLTAIPNTVFIFDIIRRSWAGPFTNWNANNFVQADVQTDDEFEFYFGTTQSDVADGGKVFQGFKGQKHDTLSISAILETKKFDFGAPMLDKIFSALEVTVSGADESLTGGLMLVEARVDDKDYQKIFSFNTEGTTGLFLPFTLPAFLIDIGGIVREQGHLEKLGRGRTIQFRLTHEDPTVASLDLSVNILNLFVNALIQNYEGEGND